LREVPFGQDGNYSHETIVARMNADLANDLGNLAQRSLSMVAKNCEGRVPKPGALSPADKTILDAADAMLARTREAMNIQQLHHALGAIWAVVADANRYFASQAPWDLRKTDPARMATVLWTTAEVTRQVAILAQPFVPKSAAKLLDSLSIPQSARSFAALGEAGRIAAGTALPAPQPVFPRYVEPEAAS
jgi:methionyl-tRNA synthetase